MHITAQFGFSRVHGPMSTSEETPRQRSTKKTRRTVALGVTKTPNLIALRSALCPLITVLAYRDLFWTSGRLLVFGVYFGVGDTWEFLF